MKVRVTMRGIKFRFLALCLITSIVASILLVDLPQVEAQGNSSFGYDTVGAITVSLHDRIRGSWFNCTQAGRVYNITAYINPDGGKYKAAIYEKEGTAFVAATEEAELPDVTQWWTFNFTVGNRPLVQASTKYYLVVWSSGGAPLIYCDEATGRGRLRNEFYTGDFPDPLGGEEEDLLYSIYCNYTTSYQYQFEFKGTYDEDTGLLKSPSERAVNVTAYYSDGTAPETFEVNGTYSYYTNNTVEHFHFELGSKDREYWVSTEGVWTVYIFNTTLTTYTITFNDLAGILTTYSWVTASRYINGSLMVVEKRKVDALDQIVMNLQQGAKYTFELEQTAATTYAYGDLLMTDTTEFTLPLKPFTFPQDIILTYKYTRGWGFRTSGETTDNITLRYEDTKDQTVYVRLWVYFYDNDTVAHSKNYTSGENEIDYTWTSAVHNLSYYSIIQVNHYLFGLMEFRNVFPRGWSENPWGLEILGSLPFGIDTNVLIPSAILIAVILIFSAVTAGVGGVIVCGVATFLVYMGWLPIPVATLAVCWILSVLYAIVEGRRRLRY